MKKLHMLFCCVFLSAADAATQPAAAQPVSLPAPTGEVVLVVDGDIAVKNAPGAARFDLEMLENLGLSSFSTATIWTSGTVGFEGVMLRRLLDHLGVTGGTVSFHAANAYTASMPVADVTDEAPLIAFRRDGKDMTLRDNGPLWIVFPYSARAEYRSEVIYSLSVWQLIRITVKN